MSARVLTLYSHKACRLCTEMRVALAPWRERHGFEVEIVDIHENPELERRYGADVPVLAEGGEEICRHFLDEAALATRLGLREGEG